MRLIITLKIYTINDLTTPRVEMKCDVGFMTHQNRSLDLLLTLILIKVLQKTLGYIQWLNFYQLIPNLMFHQVRWEGYRTHD